MEAEHKLMDKALRACEERFRLAINATKDVLWEWDILTNQNYFSPQWCEVSGYSFDNPALPHTFDKWKSRIHPDDYNRVMETINVHLEPGMTYDIEYRHQHASGEYHWHNARGQAVFDEKGKPIKMVGFISDITERKRIEDSLRESQEMYQSVIENIGIGVALISPDLEILNLNKQMRKWFPQIDILKKPVCYKAFNNPPQEGVCSYCPTYKTLQDGQVHESFTETPSGREIINYRIVSSPIKDKDGKVVAAIEMVEDITGKKKAQDALIESENRYRTIFETTAAATAIIQEDTTISLVNTELVRQSGYSKNELEDKKSFTEFIHADDVGCMLEYHRLRRIDPNAPPPNYEFRFISRDGNIRDVFLTVAMIPGTKKSAVSLLDITERKQAEEQLRKREEELQAKTISLEELNIALKVLLDHREKDKDELQDNILATVHQLIEPLIEKLKACPLGGKETAYVNALEYALQNIISPFVNRLASKTWNFTPREIQVSSLIKDGKSTKEIGNILNLSVRDIEFHRDNIRKKLGLNKTNTNLRSYLMSLS